MASTVNNRSRRRISHRRAVTAPRPCHVSPEVWPRALLPHVRCLRPRRMPSWRTD